MEIIETVKEFGATGAIIFMTYLLLKALLGRMRRHEELSTIEHAQMIAAVQTLVDRPCLYDAQRKRKD